MSPEGDLPAQPNLNTISRLGYFVAGLVLITVGILRTDADWLRTVLGLGGTILTIEGLIGY